MVNWSLEIIMCLKNELSYIKYPLGVVNNFSISNTNVISLINFP